MSGRCERNPADRHASTEQYDTCDQRKGDAEPLPTLPVLADAQNELVFDAIDRLAENR
jgi:hypothetical protein